MAFLQMPMIRYRAVCLRRETLEFGPGPARLKETDLSYHYIL